MFYFTGVGSRKAPESALSEIESLSYELAKLGGIPRSGHAIGVDTAVEEGALRFDPNHPMEIYLIKPARGPLVNDPRYIDATQLPTFKAALTLAAYFHPAWEKVLEKEKELNYAISHLHGRNIFQDLGSSLAAPSSLWVGWAKPAGDDSVQGGTNTSYRCARFWDIPTYNLFRDEDRRKLYALIEKRQ